jgi:hypothetical protein
VACPKIVLLNETPSAIARDARPTPVLAKRPRGPIAWIWDAITSVRVGIVILVALFLYSSVGSAGIVYPTTWRFMSSAAWRHDMVRQWPAFEMTEFEWFHTPVFLALCALLGICMAATTIRRIPLRTINLGVWMIHTGIIVLLIGSVIYFTTKIEGDTPVIRREVVARLAGEEARIPAVPGARRTIGVGDAQRTLRVVAVDPRWPLLSGDDAGTRVFSVSVLVEPAPSTPAGAPVRFVRQLLDGYPQYTEDVIPGRGRAVKLEEFGDPLVDAELDVTLAPGTQAWYWIRDSVAIAIRAARDDAELAPWSQRIVHGLPRYNDYIPDLAEVWPGPDVDQAMVRPLAIDVPPGDAPDALSGVTMRIIGFLRYAGMESRRSPGGDDPIPVIDLRARDPSGRTVAERIALEQPWRASPAFGGMVEVRADAWTPGTDISAQSLASRIEIDILEPSRFSAELDPNDAGARSPDGIAVGDSGWRIRIDEVLRDIDVGQPSPISLAILRITTPEGESFIRWAFPDAAMTRDIDDAASADPHAAVRDRPIDTRIVATFRPGTGAPVVLAVRPDATVRAFQRDPTGIFTERPLAPGDSVAFGGGAAIELIAVTPTSGAETRPVVVPPSARDRDSDTERSFAWILAELRKDQWSQRIWMPFCKHAFDDPEMVAAGLGRHAPTRVDLPDGTAAEIMFTRERRPLPAPVMLEEFVLTANIGGFTGDMSSIRDWTSIIRFDDDGQGWGPAKRVETNEPAAHAGLRFFQAYWDAPRDGTSGMAFTGLGVGNRRGVVTQLIGCCIAVAGMIYAFYAKPIIKRRRSDRVLAAMEESRIAGSGRPVRAMRPIESGVPT